MKKVIFGQDYLRARLSGGPGDEAKIAISARNRTKSKNRIKLKRIEKSKKLGF